MSKDDSSFIKCPKLQQIFSARLPRSGDILTNYRKVERLAKERGHTTVVVGVGKAGYKVECSTCRYSAVVTFVTGFISGPLIVYPCGFGKDMNQ